MIYLTELKESFREIAETSSTGLFVDNEQWCADAVNLDVIELLCAEQHLLLLKEALDSLLITVAAGQSKTHDIIAAKIAVVDSQLNEIQAAKI